MELFVAISSLKERGFLGSHMMAKGNPVINELSKQHILNETIRSSRKYYDSKRNILTFRECVDDRKRIVDPTTN